MTTIRERVKKSEMKGGENRFGLDMQYFHLWFDRSLYHLNNYKPTELARELARMSRAADRNVLLEKEFTGVNLEKLAAKGTAYVRVQMVDGEIKLSEISPKRFQGHDRGENDADNS